jgi:hypothetical protein
MLDAGVPREKLIEHFGFTGLSRYERMLEESEQSGRPKLIEASPVEEGPPGSVPAVRRYNVGEPDDQP